MHGSFERVVIVVIVIVCAKGTFFVGTFFIICAGVPCTTPSAILAEFRAADGVDGAAPGQLRWVERVCGQGQALRCVCDGVKRDIGGNRAAKSVAKKMGRLSLPICRLSTLSMGAFRSAIVVIALRNCMIAITIGMATPRRN
jgi:hypothetical protein